jgi:poly(A) polymerase
MTAPEVSAVLEAISRDGKEARFVGGCVRDAILKRPVADIDIATQETPDRVMALLDAAGIKGLPTGLKHGTVSAVIGEKRFEITTLRSDIRTDGRHAVVAFTEDWRKDAARRDFSFNALSATPDGMVYDYFNGMQDLADRIIRFVGPGKQRIAEDYLRVLRYFRFVATLDMRIENRIDFDACVAAAPHLKDLAGERIRDELFKILVAPKNTNALRLMRDYGILEQILPEAGAQEKLDKLVWLETSAINFALVKPDAIRRLAALLDTDGEGAAAVAGRLRLSGAQARHLAALIELGWRPQPEMGGDDLRRAFYRHSTDRARDFILLEWARRLAEDPRRPRAETDAWQEMLGATEAWDPIRFPLKGRDALALGLEEGPRVSQVLAAVEAWWVEGGCRAGIDRCRQRLKAELEGEAG